ncbi:hypothetical protein [Flagellimonas allohymeniacidonis]|uniref:Uncharacterized protein n=1 Tax=Flagellimonas allohymeniacidonis TaxID=2517819 RepID=A0A4Q8QLZ4_9FLAO|nr:hypothetical protein [Allomuricauda hymeniacidonis]TAI49609.1 hypothetical protein EW142_07370 [Allomuricauda hymeniacidonis]
MKRVLGILGIVVLTALASCEQRDTSFLIAEDSVGPLQKSTTLNELETIFVEDSIVRDTFRTKVGSKTRKIKVYERGGKHLLTLTPSQDSVQRVENIRVFDNRYTSEKGIGLQSTFRDIKQQYAIKKIVTTLNSIVVFPKASNLYFTIDKGDLPPSLRYTASNIEEVQIPDNAKVKYLMIGWD